MFFKDSHFSIFLYFDTNFDIIYQKSDPFIKLLLQTVGLLEMEDLLKNLVFLIHYYQKKKKKEWDWKKKELNIG